MFLVSHPHTHAQSRCCVVLCYVVVMCGPISAPRTDPRREQKADLHRLMSGTACVLLGPAKNEQTRKAIKGALKMENLCWMVTPWLFLTKRWTAGPIISANVPPSSSVSVYIIAVFLQLPLKKRNQGIESHMILHMSGGFYILHFSYIFLYPEKYRWIDRNFSDPLARFTSGRSGI